MPTLDENDDLLPEYAVDFSKTLPNKFAERAALSIILAPDVAEVFKTSEAVNTALRQSMQSMPDRKAS